MNPDPVWAATEAELGGADGITVHLREDRRHIQDRDVEILKQTVGVKLNLEMSINPKIVLIASRIKPDQCTLVPENRQEVTTEGGLNVVKFYKQIKPSIRKLHQAGCGGSVRLSSRWKTRSRLQQTWGSTHSNSGPAITPTPKMTRPVPRR